MKEEDEASAIDEESSAIACYDALIEALYNPENNLMLSTEQWVFHTLHNFYVNHYTEFRIVSYDSTVKRTIENHDLDWYETIELPVHDIKINIMNDNQSNKVNIRIGLVERDPANPVKEGEDEMVVKADWFFYYKASPLVHVSNELLEHIKSYGDFQHTKEYIEEEKALAFKQLQEQPWNRKRR